MPYYVVHGKPVFIPWVKWPLLQKGALGHKTPEFRISSRMEGRPEVAEAEALILDYLVQRDARDCRLFESEWLNFDLPDEIAEESTWELLYCWCLHTRIGTLRNPRSGVDQMLVDMMSGSSFTHPMGKTFHLTFPIRLGLFRTTEASVLIDTRKVKRLHGTLEDFTLETTALAITFNRTVTIHPH